MTKCISALSKAGNFLKKTQLLIPPYQQRPVLISARSDKKGGPYFCVACSKSQPPSPRPLSPYPWGILLRRCDRSCFQDPFLGRGEKIHFLHHCSFPSLIFFLWAKLLHPVDQKWKVLDSDEIIYAAYTSNMYIHTSTYLLVIVYYYPYLLQNIDWIDIWLVLAWFCRMERHKKFTPTPMEERENYY